MTIPHFFWFPINPKDESQPSTGRLNGQMSILNEIVSVAVGFYKRIQALMSTSDQSPPVATETPLLDQEQPPPDEEDDDLGQTLQRLEMFLTLLGFNQSSTRSLVLSWIVFLTIGLVLPVTVLELGHCKGCETYQNKSFELNIVVSQACLAGVSLLCVSHNLRKYGIREFLFVDQLSGRMGRLKDQYMQQISVIWFFFYFFFFLLWWFLVDYEGSLVLHIIWPASSSCMCMHQFLNVFSILKTEIDI